LRTLTRVNKRLLAALACAVGAVGCAWLYIHDVELGLRGGKKVTLLAAARDLAPGTRLTEADLALRTMPEAYVHPESAMATASDERKVLGRVVLEHLAQGQPVLWSDFESEKTKLQKGLAAVVQKGQRAITLPVDVSGSFANQLRPADRVDILGTFSRDKREVTVTVLQNVLVLSVSGRKEEVEGEKQTVVNAVTLSLDLDEAEVLAFARRHGALDYVLHGSDDIDVVADVAQKDFGDLFEDGKRAQLMSRRVRRRIEPLRPDRGPDPPPSVP
jgi:pilus assembly protein CpaB